MRIYDIIAKKRDGGTHTRAELETLINGYVAGDVPDYQMAAWMMAVYLRGMTDEETALLTDVMAHSGEMVDLSPIAGIKVDKHSTGGVTASFASLGDITLAEPGALIGFAGPRVIEQTIGEKLPKGFQRAEYLLDHGFVDQVVPRGEMKATLTRILKLHTQGGKHGA